jgi:hypothetical protein
MNGRPRFGISLSLKLTFLVRLASCKRADCVEKLHAAQELCSHAGKLIAAQVAASICR